MLIETRLWILISSESRWKLLILRKKWMRAKCFSWTWKILLRIGYIISIWIPLCPHTYVFSLSFSQIPHPSSHWLPHPIPTPNSMTYRNTQGWFPQWAGLSIMLNCLGWSCGLTLSKAIWFWDKLRSREHSPDLQDLWLNKAVSLMRKEEIKRVLAFFVCFFFGKSPVEHRNAQRQSRSPYDKLIEQLIDSGFVVNTGDWSCFSTSRK